MKDEELKAYGIDLPDAKDFLETKEKVEDFHKRLDEYCKEAFEAHDKARRQAWASSVNRYLG